MDKDKMAEDYLYLTSYVASTFSFDDPQLKEELESEALVHFASAINTWDENKDASFKTYAIHVIRNGLKNYLRLHHSRWQQVDRVGGVLEDHLSNGTNPEEELIHKELLEQAREHLNKMIGDLNLREACVLYEHILAEYPIPLREIAEEFKTSAMSIHRDKKRLLNKLREGGVDI